MNQIVLFIAAVMLFFSGMMSQECYSLGASQISDEIQPLRLTTGRSDTIPLSDLFYSTGQEITFSQNPQVDIQYDPRTQMVIFSPSREAEGIILIDFNFDGRDYVIPVRIARRYLQKFTYRPGIGVKQINLFGSFNSWNRSNLPLTDPDGNGEFEVSVPLESGRYEYKFFVDGEELIDPANPEKVGNPFGSFNSIISIPSQASGEVYLHLVRVKEEAGKITVSLFWECEKSDRSLRENEIIGILNNRRLESGSVKLDGNNIEIILDQERILPGDLLRIAVNQPGRYSYFQTIPLLPENSAETADFFSWNDAILYAIMVDRFYDGDSANTRSVVHEELDPKANFHGGDLRGILKKIEEGYFRDLGINVLWLSPVNQNTLGAFREYPPPHRYFTGYHGYWPIDPQRVDFRFGDLSLFKKMVDHAHENGLKVILDFVANHVHQEHPFFRDHPEWFGTLELPEGRKNIRLWDEYRLTTWFDTFLPSFDYIASRQAVEVMTDNALWWIKETGIDGFRQDAVKHVPNDFWRTLTRKIKQEVERKENRKIYQIGETFGGYDLISSYVNNGQLNAQFNFNLYDVALNVFLLPEGSFEILDREMHKTFQVYGVNHLMGNLMDSHDKVRFLAYADGDLALGADNAVEVGWNNSPVVDHPLSYQKARLYLAYLFTIPGVPVVYYGDEIGMTGAADPDNRRPMRFGDELRLQEKEMMVKVKNIIQIRKEHSALRHGDFLTLTADQNAYAFIRSDVNERILTVLNKSDAKTDVALTIPRIYGISTAQDLVNGETFSLLDGQIRLSVSAVDFRILQLIGRDIED